MDQSPNRNERQRTVKKEISTEDIRLFALHFLSLNSRQRESFLAHISRGQCMILRQCAYNLLLNKSIEIPTRDKIYLRKKVGIIRQLASKRVCIKGKRAILVKRGALIRRLLQIVLTYITRENQRIS